MTDWVPVKNVGKPIQIEATAAIAIHQPVKRATNGVALAGDGDPVIGVTAEAADSGETVTVWTEGVFKVTAGAALVMGALIALNATQGVDAGTSGNAVVGLVVDADISSGAKGNVLLYSDSKHTIP